MTLRQQAHQEPLGDTECVRRATNQLTEEGKQVVVVALVRWMVGAGSAKDLSYAQRRAARC
jgi:hypothetical protein